MLAVGALAVASLLGAAAWAWRGSGATVFPVTLAGGRYVPPYAMALVHAGLDERDAVFESLGRA